MPAPETFMFSPDAMSAMTTALRNLLDADAAPAQLMIYDDTDTLLVAVPLDQPCGTIDPATGVLTLAPGGVGTGVADGLASHGVFADGAGVPHIIVPVAEAGGETPVPGMVVLTSTAILVSAEVSLVSAEVGNVAAAP